MLTRQIQSQLARVQNSAPGAVMELPPGAPIVRLRFRDGQGYWIAGYEIFDPERGHSITGKSGGFIPLKPRTKPRHGQRMVIRSGQKGVPIAIPATHLAPISHGRIYYSFAEVFGQGGDLGRGGTVLKGIQVDNEYEDLGFGLDQNCEPEVEES
jgi:hypothetical protein